MIELGLKEFFPNLEELLEEDEGLIQSNRYEIKSISVFDHWLSRNEVKKQIFIDSDLEKLEKRRTIFRNFIRKIYRNTIMYGYNESKVTEQRFTRMIDFQNVLEVCDFDNLNSNTGERYCFLLPEYASVYFEGWDWTNSIWFHNQEKVRPLLELASKEGLYILSK